MGQPDKKGYYRILGIDPSGSAQAIKTAFRKRSKELHPDRNQRMGAEAQFAALNEAYRVLSDPEARAAYDTSGLGRDAPGGRGPKRSVGAPVACSRCRKVSAQPRYIIFQRVVGRLTRTDSDRVQGIYCQRCARDVAMATSLLTWALGWWGLPDGPLRTVRALLNNLAGGEQPVGANQHLLAYQSKAFAEGGKPGLSRALAHEALQLDPNSELAVGLKARIGEGEVVPLKSQWGRDPLAMVAQLLPLILIILGFWVFVVGSTASRPAVPRPAMVTEAPVSSNLAHVAVDGAILRGGPGEGHPALSRLSRFEPLTRLGTADIPGWVRVRATEVAGFLPQDQVGDGGGEAALRDWCGEHMGIRPVSGTILSRDGRGPHTLVVGNDVQTDVLVKLKDGSTTVLSFYLRAGESTVLNEIPEGILHPLYATGGRYSEGCGTFLHDFTAWAVIRPLGFITPLDSSALYAQRLILNLNAGNAVTIDPEVFTAN